MAASYALEPAWCSTTPRRSWRALGPPSAGGLKSVSTALDVLECFAVDSELGVSDIARRLGIAKSTAHRLLTTLCSRGIAEQNPDTGHYRLGLHLYELGQLAQARSILRHVALPILTRMAKITGHTVNLAVVDGPDVVFLERLEASRRPPDPGARRSALPLPLHKLWQGDRRLQPRGGPGPARRRLPAASEPHCPLAE